VYANATNGLVSQTLTLASGVETWSPALSYRPKSWSNNPVQTSGGRHSQRRRIFTRPSGGSLLTRLVVGPERHFDDSFSLLLAVVLRANVYAWKRLAALRA
jgi:hypothetical protein